MSLSCILCNQNIGNIDKHIIICPSLSNKQKEALKYVQKKSKVYSNNVKELLKIKLIEFGYNDEEIKNAIKFVKKAPFIIHFKPEHLKYYEKDTHYKNLFETNISGGSNNKKSRILWENKLFNNIYNKAEPSERVKYGTFNMDNNIIGVQRALGYGNSYFILKEHVKPRCSFVFGDSSLQDIHICNYKYFYHILYYLDNKNLELLVDKVKKYNSNYYTDYQLSLEKLTNQYIEVQYHGPILFSKDIDKIMINKSIKDNDLIMSQLNNFCKKNNIEYKFI